MHLNMSFSKWLPFCLDLNVLMIIFAGFYHPYHSGLFDKHEENRRLESTKTFLQMSHLVDKKEYFVIYFFKWQNISNHFWGYIIYMALHVRDKALPDNFRFAWLKETF